LIEASINSVRVSIKIKQVDDIENILVHKFTRFLTQRAESFRILRRKPVPGYDISVCGVLVPTEQLGRCANTGCSSLSPTSTLRRC